MVEPTALDQTVTSQEDILYILVGTQRFLSNPADPIQQAGTLMGTPIGTPWDPPVGTLLVGTQWSVPPTLSSPEMEVMEDTKEMEAY